MREQFLWVEKYRPKTIDECILPIDLKQTFKAMVAQGEVQNLLLAGPPGSGKTTVARALLEELKRNYILVNASLHGIDMLRDKIATFASSVSLTGGRKYVILDEADNLSGATQLALRSFMEQFARNCGFILTANYANKIIPAISQSRCEVIEFKIRKEDAPRLCKEFLDSVTKILETEKIEFDKKALVQVIIKHFPDWRRVLGSLQRYSVAGKIDSGILDIKTISVNELVGFMKEKNFTSVRKWVGENLNNDSQLIFREFYDNCSDLFKPSYIPTLVVTIGRYQYQAAFVVDHEINMAAFFVEVMSEAEWK